MSNFWTALTHAAKSATGVFDPAEYCVESKKVTCPHCGNQTFAEGFAQLRTAGMTFVGLEWVQQSAYTLLCSRCGRIEWFMQRPDRALK
jgi:predicted nucleic-acid-binding Zn-ribbon protein